jgi:hypothetical protein
MELLGPMEFIISGWECQGFSATGFKEGLMTHDLVSS